VKLLKSSLFGYIQRAISRFLFPIESDQWLGLLRFGLGAHVCFYCWSLRRDWTNLLGQSDNALFGRELSEAILSVTSPFIPRAGWFLSAAEYVGVPEILALDLLWVAFVVAGFCLLGGLFCRAAAIAAFVIHLAVAKSSNLLAYGMESFTTIGLFYLMIAPLPDNASMDHRLRKANSTSIWRLGFHRRVLQLHLCAVYLFGGVAKSLGSGWWNGSSVWRALVRPPFNVISPEILVRLKMLFPILGMGVLVLELGYPIFIWPRRTRYVWLLTILSMHVAIGIAMGLYLFALIMIILNLAAFGPQLGARRPGIDRKRLRGAKSGGAEAIPRLGFHSTSREKSR
jgi:hypothetical protein